MLDFEDITAFFQPGEFAQTVVIEGTGTSITAIFDNGENTFATAMGLDGSDTSPKLLVKGSDAALLQDGMNGSTVIVGSTHYMVLDKRPDITQQTFTCILQELS